ncbi:MAG: PAS-domain containing protein [Pseudomonadota bacterium]
MIRRHIGESRVWHWLLAALLLIGQVPSQALAYEAHPGEAQATPSLMATMSSVGSQLANLEDTRKGLMLGFLVVFSCLVALVYMMFRQRRSERRVQAIQQRVRESIDSLPCGFALFDKDERLVLFNDHYAALFPGAEQLLVPGTRYQRLLSKAAHFGEILDAIGRTEQWIAERLAHLRDPSAPYEMRLAAGSCYRVAERRTADGGFVAICTDITELRNSEAELWQIGEELWENNMLFDAVLHNMAQGLAMFGADNRLLVCNKRYLEIYGLPEGLGRRGVSMRTILESSASLQNLTMHDTEELVETRQQIAQSANEQRHREFMTDGRVIDMVHRPLGNGGSLATFEDVTEIEHSEQELRRAKEEAEIANQAKTEFLANVSHELRTPLNAINGFSEILAEEMFGAIGKPEYRGYAKDIHDSGQHLLSLINDILDLSKVEAGKLDLHMEEIDIARVAYEVTHLLATRADAAQVKLVKSLPHNLPRLHADSRALKQILINLLTNALKFTPSGGVSSLTVDMTEEGDMVISVSDSGIGMAEQDIPKALMPFGQVESPLTRRHVGTGLGLPLTVQLVELNGGAFSIDSQIGQGTRIDITFPAKLMRINHPAALQGVRALAGSSYPMA